MGGLGFYRLVYLSGKEFEDPDTTIEQVIEQLKTEIENEKEELLSDWEEVKSIFNKRYENTPEEQVPTRRNKVYILKEIYNEELHFLTKVLKNQAGRGKR